MGTSYFNFTIINRIDYLRIPSKGIIGNKVLIINIKI